MIKTLSPFSFFQIVHFFTEKEVLKFWRIKIIKAPTLQLTDL